MRKGGNEEENGFPLYPAYEQVLKCRILNLLDGRARLDLGHRNGVGVIKRRCAILRSVQQSWVDQTGMSLDFS